MIEDTLNFRLFKLMKGARHAIWPVLAGLGIDLAMVDLPDLLDDSVFDVLAAVVSEVAPLGRPAPAVLRPAA